MLSTVDSLTENINKIDEFIQQISSNHALIASQWANEEARKANEELHEKLKDLSHFVTDELKSNVAINPGTIKYKTLFDAGII
jgi:nitrogen regulatory protein PII-like uncharacterized protein